MALSANQLFEYKNENIKTDRNWVPVTQTLERFVSEITNYLEGNLSSHEQEVYMYLVILEDFDAYYDGRYCAIIDTWIADVWSTKSARWQEIFAKAWLGFSDNDDTQVNFRPSKLMLDKQWMETNNMGSAVITPIKSITFRD